MKAIKFTAALAILAAMIIASLSILGVISGDEAAGQAGKVIGVLVICGLGLGAIGFMMSSQKNDSKEGKKGAGPQF